MGEFTHFDASGKAIMVDVGEKPITRRTAVAKATISMKPETLNMIKQGTSKKGDVLGIARLAGIMAAKRTSNLIPLCHPLPIDSVEIELCPDPKSKSVQITSTVTTSARTGVEMEALTGATVAALTIYDMCKAVDRGMKISEVRLEQKSGGKSGDWQRQQDDGVAHVVFFASIREELGIKELNMTGQH